MIENLRKNNNLSDDELIELLEGGQYDESLFEAADKVRREIYGTDVYIRGLIEISNYCERNCFYCGIRKDNKNLTRYRLTKDEILECCKNGYGLGFRTFVLQGGEDNDFSDDVICEIVSEIKSLYADCAVTLSLGEKSYESYKSYFDSGADRYLLRHETADSGHYRQLHPSNMNGDRRKECLFELKQIGYQVGSGFLVGSPKQNVGHIIADIRFLQELQPHMLGIGPYISHRNTPFADCQNGDLNMVLRLIAVLRLMFPYALIPATTALGTIATNGRELALKAGANVVMPNLSPVRFRKNYELYDNKICTGEEAAECRRCIECKVTNIGYRIVTDVGHAKI